MSDTPIQYVSQEKLTELQAEAEELQHIKIPALAQRIDDARQLGDLSENAEYHTAREEMAWVQSRIKELSYIIQNAQIISSEHSDSGVVGFGSKITVEVAGKQKNYTIVGAQEANPVAGCISNESPLGAAFLGTRKGDRVEIQVPSGVQVYIITSVE